MKYGISFKYILFLLGLQLSLPGFSQEERGVRELFSKKIQDQVNKNKRLIDSSLEKIYQRKVTSMYHIDLNGDYRNEEIIFEKSNGIDYIHLFNYKSERIFTYKFDPSGIGGYVYKAYVVNLSNKTKALVLNYYEGAYSYKNSDSKARAYILTLDNKKLSSLTMFKGPIIWQEHRDLNSNYYFRRKYDFTAVDLNKDGIKEVLFKYKHVSKVYMYKGRGKWLGI